MAGMRTVHDPFTGHDVQISDKLTDRLRGKYASGPHLPNGNPEFGWRQFQAPPIQHEAAQRIEDLEAAIRRLWDVAETVTVDGRRGCFVAEDEWRRLVVDPAHN